MQASLAQRVSGEEVSNPTHKISHLRPSLHSLQAEQPYKEGEADREREGGEGRNTFPPPKSPKQYFYSEEGEESWRKKALLTVSLPVPTEDRKGENLTPNQGNNSKGKEGR